MHVLTCIFLPALACVRLISLDVFSMPFACAVAVRMEDLRTAVVHTAFVCAAVVIG